ncbi:MAG TPA: response regulator [Longimicrobiales bacterium]|nr:response regulator [Longimicrobiales bacterium]
MAHILIVDDEASDRLLLQRILERHGHEVCTAADGVEALLNLRTQASDLVITDLQLPDIHGLELISLLRDQSPRPIIVVVSGTGPDQLAIAKALGAQLTLNKPVYAEQLMAMVEQALASGARSAGSEPE